MSKPAEPVSIRFMLCGSRQWRRRRRCYIARMGVLSPQLFDDDTAADVRGTYRSYIEQGVDDGEALRRILEQYQRLFDREDGVGALVGFAVTQSELGRLDPPIRDQAIAAIDHGGDLQRWQRDSPHLVDERRAVLSEARARLNAPSHIGCTCPLPIPSTPIWSQATFSRSRFHMG